MDGRVVSNFIVQALRGEKLTIYGDGSQTRSFCYVDDLISGLVKMMESDESGPINLGNPSEISVMDLAKEVISLTGSSSAVELLPLPQDDPRQRKPDIALARKKLGWEPSTSLKFGLERTIEFFRSIT